MPDASHLSIGLVAEACTACMICVRECPSWCIELTSHPVEIHEPGARRPKIVHELDSFSIDYGSCINCGICVEVCPFDALHWSAQAPVASAQRTGAIQQLPELEQNAPSGN